MDGKDGEKVTDAIISAIRIICLKIATQLGFDKTFSGKVVAVTLGNTYTVQVYNKNYPNVKSRDNRVYAVNDIVDCTVLQNQWKNLKIVGLS